MDLIWIAGIIRTE